MSQGFKLLITLIHEHSTHLLMVGSQHNPAAEAVAEVDHGGAAAKSNDIGERSSQCDDQDLRRNKNS